MKWISLLWSIVLLGALTLLIVYMSSRPSQAIIGPAFGYVLIIWFSICIISPIVIVLRLFRIIRSSSSFIYILTGTASLAIGLLGMYFMVLIEKVASHIGMPIVYILNVLIGSYIYTDAFIKPIPGLRKDHTESDERDDKGKQ